MDDRIPTSELKAPMATTSTLSVRSEDRKPLEQGERPKVAPRWYPWIPPGERADELLLISKDSACTRR